MTKTLLAPIVAERLRKVTAKLGITQKRLAEAGTVSTNTMRNILAGNSTPKVKALYWWSQNLNISTQWLICGEGYMFLPDENGRTDSGVRQTQAQHGPIAKAVSEVEKAMEGAEESTVARAVVGTLVDRYLLRESTAEYKSHFMAQEESMPYGKNKKE